MHAILSNSRKIVGFRAPEPGKRGRYVARQGVSGDRQHGVRGAAEVPARVAPRRCRLTAATDRFAFQIRTARAVLLRRSSNRFASVGGGGRATNQSIESWTPCGRRSHVYLAARVVPRNATRFIESSASGAARSLYWGCVSKRVSYPGVKVVV